MVSPPRTVNEYLATLSPDRRRALAAVRAVIRKNLPRGVEEGMQYRMIGYSIPLSRHPDTYNGQPLCFAALASQKGYMSLYLMSVYADPGLRRWFEKAWKESGRKLDMGKSCVRFRSLDDLPLQVVAEAIAKVSAEQFIAIYEKGRKAARPTKAPTKAPTKPSTKPPTKPPTKPSTKPSAEVRGRAERVSARR